MEYSLCETKKQKTFAPNANNENRSDARLIQYIRISSDDF